MENSDSCSAEKDYLRDRPVAGASQSKFNLNPSIAETSRSSNQTQSRTAESPLVQDVFSMFKSYLEVRLEEKGKQIEGKSETDKQVAQLRSLSTTPSSILCFTELERRRMVPMVQ